ncbi:response regulator [Sphaerotilus natans]|uniref:response regulator n=1 Tax=Sphaerotilus natans TaxID=34103 RepID=UPI00406C561C
MSPDSVLHHEPEAGSPVLRLARQLRACTTLGEALAQALEALCQHTGASGGSVLKVEDGEPGCVLLRPWPLSSWPDEDRIDLDQLAPCAPGQGVLGQALATLAPAQGRISLDAFGPMPWWPPGLSGLLALPVLCADRAVAVLELHQPRPLAAEVRLELEWLGQTLGLLAERERQRERLAQAGRREARLQMLAARIGQGVLITDAQGLVEWVHPGFAQVSGHAPERLQGRRLWEILPGTGGEDTRAALMLRDSLLRGDDFVREMVALRGVDDVLPGGSYWLEIDGRVVIDTVECQPRVVCVCRDVTDRKEREFGIDEGRALLAVLTEHIPISLVVLDAQQFRVVSLNRQAELEFSVAGAQAGGRGLDELLGTPVEERLRPQLVRALGSTGSVEHEFSCPGGAEGERLFSARHVAVRNRLGRPTVLICQLRDITQQRRDARQLRESEERYRELVEAIDEGVFVTSNRSEEPSYVGARVLDMLGLPGQPPWPADGLLSLRVLEQDRPQLERQRELERQGSASDVTLRIHHPVHGLRWLRQRTRVRQLPGGEMRVYGLLDDVTEERERELQLQTARDAAESASRAKSQFMATMSHEIRTPMNGILGMTELLLGTRLDDRQRRFAQAVYRSGESLLEIINDVLDFAKIEAGRLELVTAEFGLHALLDDTLELLAPRAHEKGLELIAQAGDDLPPVVRADALRLRQVLTNLVSNAIKFTERGEVAVHLRLMSPLRPVHGDPADAVRHDLVVEVRDTGIGIAPEAVPRLFTAFTQVHEGMARRYGGTGLGLAISRQLVELMGGTIEVESRPGLGSVFRFTVPVGLPAAGVSGPAPEAGSVAASPQAPQDPALSDPAETAPLPGLSVLVVDDHETNRTVLDNQLGAWGLRVTLAAGGEQALALLRQQAQRPGELPFDLLLIDWHMPDMDGIALAQHLRQQGLARQAHKVLLSSVAAPDDARIARDAGFDLFLHKPVRRTELRQLILGLGAEARPAGEVAAPQFGAQVLVVEDNPVNQEVMGQMLQRLGCAVRVAGSAMEGLRQLCERRFDLVLMDIQMPGMDGIEALRCLRSGPDARWRFVTPRRTPVIAVTANALEGDEDRFLSLGFDAYLAKPYRQTQLLALLARFLGDRLGPEGMAEVEAAAHTAPGELAPARVEAELERIEHSLRLELPEPEPEPQPELLDPQAMKRLYDLDPGGRNQLVRRVMQAFDASIGRLLPMLEPGPLGHDPAAVRHVTHTLRSSAASLGALRLAALCGECEQALRQGQDARTLTTMLQGLSEEMIRIQTGVRQRLETMTAAAPAQAAETGRLQ